MEEDYLMKKMYVFMMGLVLSIFLAWVPGFAEIFVTNDSGDSVTVFSNNANGNQAPLRTISGSQTGLSGQPRGIFADSAHGEIFVATQSGDVLVFDIGATGDTAPKRQITQNVYGDFQGIFVDLVNNEIFLANRDYDAVTVFNRTDSGSLAPKRTIRGSNTGLNEPRGIYVDTTNNEIYVANNYGSSITVYSRTADGNVAPVRTITSSTANLGDIQGIFVDTAHNEIFAAGVQNALYVFPRTANGDTAPVRTISGASTGLNGMRGVFVDVQGNEIYAGNRNGDSVTVYSRTADGDVAPLRSISGSSTNLDGPRFVWATPAVPKAAPVTEVPTVNEWGMFIFIVLAGLVSLFYLKRSVTGVPS